MTREEFELQLLILGCDCVEKKYKYNSSLLQISHPASNAEYDVILTKDECLLIAASKLRNKEKNVQQGYDNYDDIMSFIIEAYF